MRRLETRRIVGERVVIWTGRAGWALLPLTVDADATRPVAVALWAAWAATLVATLVPHPAALTTWRVAAPAAVVVAMVEASVPGTVNAVVAAAIAFTPQVAIVAVNGPAYANERRYPLRPPAWVIMGPAALAWAVLVGGPSAAMVLLADERWVPGVAVAVVGGVLAAGAGRALHGLARRWLVFVPAGIVVHDPLTLADPVLFQRPAIDSLGPAPAEPSVQRIDITAGALGLPLEMRFAKPADIFVITKPGRRPTAETVTTSALLVAPTRAAAVLIEARDRGYRIG